jgi:hypothetical protein
LELGCFRVGTFWALKCCGAWDVLELGRSEAGTFLGLGCFEAGTLWGWDVLGLGPYGVGRFVVGTFCSWDVL